MVTFLIIVLCIIMFVFVIFSLKGINSYQIGSGVRFKKKTVKILWCCWFFTLFMIILMVVKIGAMIKNEANNEWELFKTENQCVLTKITKNKKNNIWTCKNGTLEVINDYIE